MDPYNFALVSEAAPVLVSQERDQELIDLLAPRLERLQERIPEVWAYLALAYEHTDRHSDALEAMDKAVALAPDSGPVLETRDEIE